MALGLVVAGGGPVVGLAEVVVAVVAVTVDEDSRGLQRMPRPSFALGGPSVAS